MKLKRIAAFLIDLIIVSAIANLIFSLPMFESNNKELLKANTEMTNYITEVDNTLDMEKLNDITYNVVYSGRILTVIELAITILYFGVLQFIMDGQTLGKRLLKIKIEPVKGKTLNPGLFILRALILNNIIFNLISTTCIILLDKNNALKINSYCSYGILLVQIAIIGTIIFREDERGLHDLIANTKVISTKKEK